MNNKLQRTRRTRERIRKAGRLRLSVFRSNKYIYAQIIDDSKGVTLVTASGRKAKEVGQKLGEKAKAKKISEVVFDRGPYKYHGQVKQLAEGAREGGLKF